MKISALLRRAQELLTTDWRVHNDYAQRALKGEGHHYLCHAILQAEQEARKEAFRFPSGFVSYCAKSEAIQFIYSLGLSYFPSWGDAELEERAQIRFMFLEFAILVAEEEGL